MCDVCKAYSDDYYSWKYNGTEFLLCRACNDSLDTTFVEFLTPKKVSDKKGDVLYLKKAD
jgi:hypothetical protein